MTLALTVTDNGDGTGALASITGSAGASNIVYVQSASGNSLSPVGSRTGDGNVPLSLNDGHYLALVQANGGVFTSLYPFLVTNNAEAVHERCVLAIKAIIQTLVLPNLDPSRVVDQILPTDANLMYPAVLITIEGEAEEEDLTMTSTDDILYPVRVWICDRSDSMSVEKRSRYLLWRQRIHRALRHRRLLPSVTEVIDVRTRLMPVVDFKVQEFQVVTMGLVVLCRSREPRG